MKKVILVAAVAAFSLASCKKDYTCECTFDDGTTTSATLNGKKSDVKTACENSSSISGVTCKIK